MWFFILVHASHIVCTCASYPCMLFVVLSLCDVCRAEQSRDLPSLVVVVTGKGTIVCCTGLQHMFDYSRDAFVAFLIFMHCD
jgi:hypothetical protein